MSRHDHTDFFGDHSISNYFAALSSEQKELLDDFYHTHCAPSFDQRHVQNSGDRLLPLAAYDRTPHNLFVAAKWAMGAHQNTDDYDILTCQREGETMRIERFEVLDVKHVVLPGAATPDRIIYAKGETTSKKAALELGSKATWLELAVHSDEEQLRRLPLDHFVLPHH